jgi:TonB family protein
MDELSSPAAVIEITNAARWGLKLPPRMRKVLISLVVSLVSISALHAQPTTPLGQPPPPQAIYTPKPVYRPEWAKQGLTGKGVVLITIDGQTGKVTGARMLTSTGNQQLDGAALQAYSQWRFDPRTVAVAQLKIPIEFAKRPAPAPATARHGLPKPMIFLIVLAIAGAAMGFFKRRRA